MKAALRLLLAPYRFSVDRLFRMGQVGGAHWFDSPSLYPGGNHLYLYQDSAGTTPVTAVGDTIGLSLDRAYGGYRGANMAAANYTTAPTYDNGTTVVSATAFTQTAGTTAGRTYLDLVTVANKTYELTASVTTNDATGGIAYARAGSAGAGTILGQSNTITSSGTQRLIFTATGSTTNILWTTTAVAKTISASNIAIREIPGTHLIQATSASRPTLSARVNLLLNTATMSTQNVTTIAASYKLSFTGTGTVTLSGTSTAGPLVGTGANDRVSLTFAPTAGTLTLTVSGSVTLADLRTADDAAKNIPAYQRVGATAADHDTDGFPHYALFDGTDDSWASVAAVNGSADSKLTFVCGFTKNSDAATAVVAELGTGVSAATTSYSLAAPSTPATAQVRSIIYDGTTNASVTTTGAAYAAPFSSVTSSVADFAGSPEIAQYINGVAGPAASGGPLSDSANFNSFTLYVGSRGGSSLRFNGRLYALVFRFGAMGDTDRNRSERWTKNLMRLT